MKKIITAICIILTFLLIVPIIINLIVSNTLSLHFITDSTRNAWIGYYSAILGGSLTLGGVAWTVSNQTKQHKTNLALQYKPVPSITITPDNHSTGPKMVDTLRYGTNNKENIYCLRLNIKNIGRGEMINLQLEELQISLGTGLNNPIYSFSTKNHSEYDNFFIQALYIQSEGNFNINIDLKHLQDLLDYKDKKHGDLPIHTVKGSITYKDGFENKYSLHFTLYGLTCQKLDYEHLKYGVVIHENSPNQYMISTTIKKIDS